MILLDANVLIYYLDDSADNHKLTNQILQNLVNLNEQLACSHHIIEEVLYVIAKNLPECNLIKAVEKIGSLPNLFFIEPAAHINFAVRYAALAQKHNLDINDALVLQLALDFEMNALFSFDAKLLNTATKLNINVVPLKI